MTRRTKIVATLGPSTDKEGVLEALIKSGVNVVRFNFSHGSADDHRNRAIQVRQLAKKYDVAVAILGDLQGPKIRISKFQNGPITLIVGDRFVLDAELGTQEGHQSAVGIDYKALPSDVSPGDNLLLDDGRVVLQVKTINGAQIETEVKVAGKLSNNKGINREGGGLSASALTTKDYEDIKLAAEIGVDYLAVSFVREAAEIAYARKLLKEAGGSAYMVAKIERSEAVVDEALEAIITESDAVMVARGDLGVEIGDAALIAVQKRIIAYGNRLMTPVITATQMMESMIESPLPTRAEVFDVANAVLDGTDAVMLSGETAAGQFPVEAVEAMSRVIVGAESHPEARRSAHRLNQSFSAIDEGIAMAAMYSANHLDGVKAIINLTETGTTPLYMSRISSGLPIVSFTDHEKTRNRLALFRGVLPKLIDTPSTLPEKMNQRVVDELIKDSLVTEGDLVIITKGDFLNVHGGTNAMKIVKIGEPVK